MNVSELHIVKRKNRLEFSLRLIAPLAWALAMLWLSLSSTPPQIPGPLGWDKLLHAGAYALLAFLVVQFLNYINTLAFNIYITAFFAAVVYGGLIELLQGAGHAGRSAEWWDLVADIIGAIAGCAIFRHASSVSFCLNERKNEHNG